MSTALAVVPAHVPAEVGAQVALVLPQVADLLPRDISPAKFQAGLWLEFTRTPRLNEATPVSVVSACVEAATHEYLPGRDCHILPFFNKQKRALEATMVENYQGVCRRLDRTGRVAWAKAEAIYKEDHFTCDELAEVYEFRRHLGPRTPQPGTAVAHPIGYFAAIKLTGADAPIVRPCHTDEIEQVRQRAPGGEQSAWKDWPVEMGRKTALKKLAKYLQLVDDDEPEAPARVSDTAAQQHIVDLYGGGMPSHDWDTADTPRAGAEPPNPQPLWDAIGVCLATLGEDKHVWAKQVLRQHPGVARVADLSYEDIQFELAALQAQVATVQAAEAALDDPQDATTVTGLRDLCMAQGLTADEFWHLCTAISPAPTDEWGADDLDRYTTWFFGLTATAMLAEVRGHVAQLGIKAGKDTDTIERLSLEHCGMQPMQLDWPGLAQLAMLLREPMDTAQQEMVICTRQTGSPRPDEHTEC